MITRESLLLTVLLLMAAALWGFIELQDEVREGDPLLFDEQILLFFRAADDPGQLRGPVWMEKAWRDITSLGGGSVLTLITLGATGFFVLRRQWIPVAVMLLTVIGGAFVLIGLKGLYERERPQVTAHLVEEISSGFPSGHSTMAMVVYLTLAVMLAEFQKKRRIRVYILGYGILLALLVGISRIILGVHYPSDVAAGWTFGLLWALLGWIAVWLLKRSAPKLEIPPDEAPM